MLNVKKYLKASLVTIGIFLLLSIPSLLILLTDSLIIMTLYAATFLIIAIILPIKKVKRPILTFLIDCLDSVGIFILLFLLQILNPWNSSKFSQKIMLTAFDPYNLAKNTYYSTFISPFGKMESWEVPEIHQTIMKWFAFLTPVVYWLIVILLAIRICRWTWKHFKLA